MVLDSLSPAEVSSRSASGRDMPTSHGMTYAAGESSLRDEQIDARAGRLRSRGRRLLQNGVGQRGRSRERGHFAQLQAHLQQLDAGYAKGFSHQRRSGDILRRPG